MLLHNLQQIDKRKYLTVAGHGLLAAGGAGLFVASLFSGWSGIGKMITGALNFGRNLWQIALFSQGDRKDFDDNQVKSNVISSLTNLPQIVSGFLTHKWVDVVAPAMMSSMYGLRAYTYWEKAKGKIHELESEYPEAGKLTRNFADAATQAAAFLYEHKYILPGTIMTLRGVIQSFENPWTGLAFGTAGLITLYVDFNDHAMSEEKAAKPAIMLAPVPT